MALQVRAPATAPPATCQVARYDQARWALSTRELSKDPGLAWEALGYPPPAGGAPGEGGASGQAGASGQGWVRNLTNVDPPEHTRLRRLLAGALTPARMLALAPRITAAARRLGTSMARSAGSGEVDLVASYIVPLQAVVTGDLLGVDSTHRRAFEEVAVAMLADEGDGEAYRRMAALIEELLDLRRAGVGRTTVDRGSMGPEADLLGALLAAAGGTGSDGSDPAGTDGLSPAELVSMAMLVITAGQEPTVDLIANGLLALLAHGDQLALFRREPSVRARAVEELLRLEAPVPRAIRIAPAPVRLGDTVAPSGGLVEVALDQAHRDRSQFAEPEALDITRQHNPHLSFGHGPHYCLGAPLARVQARIAIGELLERFPGLALARDVDQLAWHPGSQRHGLVELPVRLGTSPTAGVAFA